MEKEIKSALPYVELHVQIHVDDLMSSICLMTIMCSQLLR